MQASASGSSSRIAIRAEVSTAIMRQAVLAVEEVLAVGRVRTGRGLPGRGRPDLLHQRPTTRGPLGGNDRHDTRDFPAAAREDHFVTGLGPLSSSVSWPFASLTEIFIVSYSPAVLATAMVWSIRMVQVKSPDPVRHRPASAPAPQ